MVVFVDGKPKKSEYRKYKLRDVAGNDDFEAMKEVMTRRYGAEEGPGELPDLIVIDGGKGQLSHAMEILEGLGLTEKVHVVGLAKRLEEVFFPRSSEAVVLPKTSSSLRLLQQARDEAHRFAVSYHRKLRDKRTLQSELTGINGVGERTAQKLLQTFGSVEQVKAASMDALASVVGPAIARTIFEHYHP
jgi:excinuclease ABC subunit C